MAECFVGGFSGGSSVGCGVYTGDGQSARFIDLGVAPKWVLVTEKGKIGADDDSALGGLALAEYPMRTRSGITSVKVSGNGFWVFVSPGNTASPRTNETGALYYYLYGI